MIRTFTSGPGRVRGLLAAALLLAGGACGGAPRPAAAPTFAATSSPASSAAAVTAPNTSPVSSESRVWFVDADTGSARRAPKDLWSLADPGEYQVSPDGTRVAFRASDTPQIYVVDIDGAHLRRVTDEPGGAWAPAWSPDGSRLVYVKDARWQAIGIVDLRTGRTELLLEGALDLWLPHFSPDSRAILFTRSTHEGDDVSMWAVPAVGGRATRVADRAAFGAPSPDGSSIAFHRIGGAVAPSTWPFDFGIWLMDAEGDTRRPLVAHPSWTMAPFDWDWTRPVWSPDGTRLAYLRPGKFGALDGELVVVEVATGDIAELGTGHRPAWVDDDTLIVQGYTRHAR